MNIQALAKTEADSRCGHVYRRSDLAKHIPELLDLRTAVHEGKTGAEAAEREYLATWKAKIEPVKDFVHLFEGWKPYTTGPFSRLAKDPIEWNIDAFRTHR